MTFRRDVRSTATATAMPDVAVVGSVNIDHVVTARAFPRPGETVLGASVGSSVGGKGANQAVAARLAGASVAMVASTGDDDGGGAARDRLLGRGVDISDIAVLTGEPTGTAWITVAEQDNTIIVVQGANSRWPAELPACVAEATVVLAQLEIPLEVVLATARQATGTFVLNAAPATAVPDELLSRCHVLVVNEHELAVTAGLSVTAGEADVLAAHHRLLDRGVGAVVTTLGAAGAVVTGPDRTTSTLPAVPADVVDTTGAGDAVAGVLAARLAAGDSLVDAARWGVAAGSLAVRSAGAQESYPELSVLRRTVEGPGDQANGRPRNASSRTAS